MLLELNYTMPVKLNYCHQYPVRVNIHIGMEQMISININQARYSVVTPFSIQGSQGTIT